MRWSANRTTVVLLAFAVLSACGQGRLEGPATKGRPRPSPAGGAAADETDVYVAVIRRLVTKDHTFGGDPPPFRHAYVIDGVVTDAGDPMKDHFGPAPEPFDPHVKRDIRRKLRDLLPVRFVRDGDEVRLGDQGMDGVRNDGVIISLGAIQRRHGRVQVGSGLWCGGLCGRWLTYVLERQEGRWRVTGTTGPAAIS